MSPTGHFAAGIFGKRKTLTQIPLVWLLAGSELIDVVYGILSMLGFEKFGDNPWSHSLVMALVYTIVAMGLTYVIFKKKSEAYVMGSVVFSHWILDFIVWNNLPLAFGKTPLLGLGLYQRIGFDITSFSLNASMVIATSLELGLLILAMISHRPSKQRQEMGTKNG